MLAHHRGVALEAAAGENDGVRRKRCAVFQCERADAARLRDDRARRAAMPDRDAGRAGGARQRRDDRRPAARRLDARGAFREIIGRLNERDAVRLDPRDGRGRVGGEAREIGRVAVGPVAASMSRTKSGSTRSGAAMRM